MRIGERVREVASLNYTAQCISEKSFGIVVIVLVLGCRGDECPRQVSWEHRDRLCVLFLRADMVEYLREKGRVLYLLYSFVGLQGKTVRGFPIILPSCC